METRHAIDEAYQDFFMQLNFFHLEKINIKDLEASFSKLSKTFRNFDKNTQNEYQVKINHAVEKIFFAYKKDYEKMPNFCSDKMILARNFYEAGYKRPGFISSAIKNQASYQEMMNTLYTRLEGDYEVIVEGALSAYFLENSSLSAIHKVDEMLNFLDQLQDKNFKLTTMKDAYLWKAVAETHQPLTLPLRIDLILLSQNFFTDIKNLTGKNYKKMWEYWTDIQIDHERPSGFKSSPKLYPIVQKYEHQLQKLLPSANCYIENNFQTYAPMTSWWTGIFSGPPPNANSG